MSDASQAVERAAKEISEKTKVAKKGKAQSRNAGVMATVRARGGMTREEIAAECAVRGLGKKSATNYAWAAKQAGLLK